MIGTDLTVGAPHSTLFVVWGFSNEQRPPEPPQQTPNAPVKEPPDAPQDEPHAPVREPGGSEPKKWGAGIYRLTDTIRSHAANT